MGVASNVIGQRPGDAGRFCLSWLLCPRLLQSAYPSLETTIQSSPDCTVLYILSRIELARRSCPSFQTGSRNGLARLRRGWWTLLRLPAQRLVQGRLPLHSAHHPLSSVLGNYEYTRSKNKVTAQRTEMNTFCGKSVGVRYVPR